MERQWKAQGKAVESSRKGGARTAASRIAVPVQDPPFSTICCELMSVGDEPECHWTCGRSARQGAVLEEGGSGSTTERQCHSEEDRKVRQRLGGGRQHGRERQHP